MKKRNICIISWYDADDVVNYGQILQAIAMSSILSEYSLSEIKFISYFPRNFKGLLRYVYKHLGLSNGHFISYLRTLKTIRRCNRQFKVRLFRINNAKKLNRITKNVDVMICGSDQIWHPSNYDEVFYLNFGPKEAVRIAFSASLPKTREEIMFSKQYLSIRKVISKIDHIAVREQSSVEFVKALSKKNVVSVLDPTLSVNKSLWKEIIEKCNVPEEYIFVYIPNGMNMGMVSFINEIKEKYGILNVLTLTTRGENLCTNAINLGFVSLGEFLYLIKNAKTIVTSSFHAIVFSIIFHKEFYAYEVENNARGEDCRLRDILATFGLDNRLAGNTDCDNIDYARIDEILREKKITSLSYLREFMGESFNG